MSTFPALRLAGVGRRHAPDRWVLRGIDLEIVPGECVALVGESGVGKSTLLNLVAGLDTPDEGSIEIDDGGTPVRIDRLDADAAARLRAHAFGFVFQAFHLVPHLTVVQNVALPRLIARAREREALDDATRLLERLGLGTRLLARPGELSGGEQQRIALARALVNRPRLVLADEPTGNLDPRTADRALALLRDEAREAGAAILMVTHSLHAAAGADRALRLEPDRLVPATGLSAREADPARRGPPG